MKYLFFISAFLLTTSGLVGQQAFDFSAVAGLNLAQLDGDLLAGYDKPGLSVGGRLSYGIRKEMDLCLEMLYSVRGSQEQLFGDDISATTLQYLEMPILFSYKDWLIPDEGYHKVRVEGGLSYAVLFNFESENTLYRNIGEDIREYDVSYILGVGYNFGPRLGCSFRYTRSLVDLYRPVGASLVSYFLTLRAEYTF